MSRLYDLIGAATGGVPLRPLLELAALRRRGGGEYALVRVSERRARGDGDGAAPAPVRGAAHGGHGRARSGARPASAASGWAGKPRASPTSVARVDGRGEELARRRCTVSRRHALLGDQRGGAGHGPARRASVRRRRGFLREGAPGRRRREGGRRERRRRAPRRRAHRARRRARRRREEARYAEALRVAGRRRSRARSTRTPRTWLCSPPFRARRRGVAVVRRATCSSSRGDSPWASSPPWCRSRASRARSRG